MRQCCDHAYSYLPSTRALFNRLIKPEVRRQLEYDSHRFPPTGANRRIASYNHPTRQRSRLQLVASTTTKANRADKKNYHGHCRPQEWQAQECKPISTKSQTESPVRLATMRPIEVQGEGQERPVKIAIATTNRKPGRYQHHYQNNRSESPHNTNRGRAQACQSRNNKQENRNSSITGKPQQHRGEHRSARAATYYSTTASAAHNRDRQAAIVGATRQLQQE
jgi:hypothetical protein